MVRQKRKQQQGRYAFLILVVIVLFSGVLLWSQGDLISPLQSTTLLLNTSSDNPGFAMVDETGQTAARPADTTDQTGDAAAAEPGVIVAETTASQTTTVQTGAMTMETFLAELKAAGVDVDTVSATMSAEGRSMDNLLAVVNSGRVTVADLAARLKGDSASSTGTPAAADENLRPDEAEQSASLVDIRWDEIGSVLYDLWFILATTAIVIILARPAGLLVNRIKRAPRTAAPVLAENI